MPARMPILDFSLEGPPGTTARCAVHLASAGAPCAVLRLAPQVRSRPVAVPARSLARTLAPPAFPCEGPAASPADSCRWVAVGLAGALAGVAVRHASALAAHAIRLARPIAGLTGFQVQCLHILIIRGRLPAQQGRKTRAAQPEVPNVISCLGSSQLGQPGRRPRLRHTSWASILRPSLVDRMRGGFSLSSMASSAASGLARPQPPSPAGAGGSWGDRLADPAAGPGD